MQKTLLDSVPIRPQFHMIAGRQMVPDSQLEVQKVIHYIPEWILEAEFSRQSPCTIEGKKISLDKFAWWLQNEQKTQVTQYEVKAYVSYITNAHLHGGRWGNPKLVKPLSERGVEFHFVNIRTYFRWLVQVGIAESCPADGFQIPKPEDPLIQPFTPDQVKVLLMAAQRTTDPTRDTAILCLLFDTGIRASELCDLKLADITTYRISGQVNIESGKGGKSRIVPFDRDTVKAIWAYMEKHPRDLHEPFFCGNRGPHGSKYSLTRSGLQQLFHRLERLSGITGVRVSPHTCRHTFAIEFLRGSDNLEALRLMLGHEDLDMVKTYAKLSHADVAKAHQASSPLGRILRPGT